MVVLDVCAAVQMALGTKEGCALRALLLEGEKVIVPIHFKVELLNVLCKMVRAHLISKDAANDYCRAIDEIVTERVDVIGFEAEIIEEACALKHPAYDIFYFILARRNAATLITIDKKLQKLCFKNHVNCTLLIDI